MNKAVIKKYRECFDWWLDGGQLQTRNIKYIDGISSEWHVTVIPYCNYQFIINDKYVEFRKALAEGKTVEKCYYESVDNPRVWKDMEEDFCGMIETYRIKPNEIEFKVGDYVYSKSGITTIIQREDGIFANNATSLKDIKLWTLEEADDDEWVIVKDTTSGDFKYTLTQVSEVPSDCYLPIRGYKVYPYIGQTPAQLGLEK